MTIKKLKIIIIKKREKTGERKGFLFPATAQFPRSRAHIFACFSLTRENWVRDYDIPTTLACVAVRRLEVMGAGKNGARKGDTLSPRVSLSRAPFFLPPITCKRLLRTQATTI